MPNNEHRADPTPPPHHGQGNGDKREYNSVFRVCYITSIDVDVILGTCSTIELITCYPK